MRNRIVAATLLLTLTLTALTDVQAQSYPARPVRVIVPSSAGGITDLVARIIADYLSARLKGQFIVDNRTGAGGNVGAEALAKAEPDGYALGLLTTGNVVINPFVYKGLQYDSKADLTPVASIVEAPQVLAVNKDVPARTLKELIALAKRRPGTLAYASAGAGSTMHLAVDQFARLAGIELVHVPYRGAAPAVTDVVSGTVQIISISAGPIMGFVRSGDLRVLAAASAHRLTHFPDVPTAEEAGLPGYEMTTWFGLFAPAGTPAGIVETLHRAVNDMLSDPAKIKRLEESFVDPMPMTQSQFAEFVAAEFAKWETRVRAAGLKAE